MNKADSKYFSTAARMDEALLALLEKKDLPYITVKEICQQAGVNRSTFYLHYETIGDLLAESVQYMTERFLEHMRQRSAPVLLHIHNLALLPYPAAVSLPANSNATSPHSRGWS